MSIGYMENISIQGLLDSYLRGRTEKVDVLSQHLDDDLLSSFVEGRLGESELKPVTAHLLDCGFCRNVTAELVRLDFSMADNNLELVATEAPTKVSEVMNGFFTRLFGTSMGEVFAHQETDEEEKSENEK